MMRVIMFQSELSLNGMTGWTLRMNRVSSEGPTFCSQLNWNGTLTRSKSDSDSFLGELRGLTTSRWRGGLLGVPD